MKLRNQLIALCCLLAFIGLGLLYFRVWVVQKPFAIILFVADGLTPGNLTAARLFDGGAEHRLAMEALPNVALLANYANDYAVADTPAAATALATGVKTNKRAVSISAGGESLPTILELAREKGRAIGVVTNGRLTDPGIAAFYGHVGKSDERETLAAQLVDAAKPDVALGGGAHDFTTEGNGGGRKDGRDLIVEMKQGGRVVMRSKSELENTPIFSTAPRIGLFAQREFFYAGAVEAGSQQPSLSDMTRRAIEFLQLTPGGYLLVVDATLIGNAAEQNDGEHTLGETVELDRAIATALKYAGGKAVVMVAGRTGKGGMTLNGYPLRTDHGVGLLGTNPFGYPAITWATGPHGTAPAASPEASPAGLPKEPAAFHAAAAIDEAGDVIAIGTGAGTEKLKGFRENTIVFEILRSNL